MKVIDVGPYLDDWSSQSYDDQKMVFELLVKECYRQLEIKIPSDATLKIYRGTIHSRYDIFFSYDRHIYVHAQYWYGHIVFG